MDHKFDLNCKVAAGLVDRVVVCDAEGRRFNTKESQIFYLRCISSVRSTCYGRPSYVRNGYPVDVKNLRRNM
jgi:hypothetical protein